MAVAVAVFIVFLLVAVVSDYRPEDCEAVYAYSADGGDAGLAGDSRQGIRSGMDSAAVVQLGCDAQNGEDSLGSFHSEAASKNSAAQITDSLKIVTWNIGYGGLGGNMDFFYDGGTRIRDTKARSLENLKGILAEMKALDADIYLLQEVEILLYEHNRVNALQIRLLKEDAEGNEWGLLWVLGITGTSETQTVKDPSAVAKRVQKSMAALLEGWQQSGYLGSLQYQMLSAQDGFGVRMMRPQ